MLDLAKQYSAPVHLAVIPNSLQDSLAIIKTEQYSSDCFVLQHGFDHQSYARAEQRKIELGGTQVTLKLLPNLLANLTAGHRLLTTQFDEQYLPILVPPWNRIDPLVESHLADLGYQQLSVLASKKLPETNFHLNVHIDIIDWKLRGFAGEEQVLTKIISCLTAQRLQLDTQETRLNQHSTPFDSLIKPLGLMTHHLDHDIECWNFLTRFFAFCQQQNKVTWLSGKELAQFA